jgi:hypothetical protein
VCEKRYSILLPHDDTPSCKTVQQLESAGFELDYYIVISYLLHTQSFIQTITSLMILAINYFLIVNKLLFHYGCSTRGSHVVSHCYTPVHCVSSIFDQSHLTHGHPLRLSWLHTD